MADFVWTGASSTAFNTAGNWLNSSNAVPGSAPTTGDNVLFDGRAQRNCDSGGSGVVLGTMRVTSEFTKQLGLYSAGKVTPLAVGPATLLIGEPRADGTFGSGSTLLAIDLSTSANTTRVFSTGTTGTAGFPPVLLKGTHSSRTLRVHSGWVGDGVYLLGESTTISVLSVLGPRATVEVGSGATLGTVHQTDGNLFFRCAMTAFNQEGGRAQSEGSGAITTADIGGQFVSNSTGTITNANVQNNGVFDLSQSNASRTVSNCVLYGTGEIVLPVPYSAITLTNGIDLLRDATTEQIRGGVDVTVSLSAP